MNILSKIYNRNIVIISAIITVLVFLALRHFDNPLHTSVAPKGIISFEFAKNVDTANQIINSWDTQAKINAGLSLGIDYLFLFAYSILFSAICFFISVNNQARNAIIHKIGIILSYLLLIAGVFDAIENFALIKLLLGSQAEIYPIIAFYFASGKFMILALGIIYIIFFGILANIFSKIKN